MCNVGHYDDKLTSNFLVSCQNGTGLPEFEKRRIHLKSGRRDDPQWVWEWSALEVVHLGVGIRFKCCILSEPPPHTYFPSEACLTSMKVNCGMWRETGDKNECPNEVTRQVLVCITYCEWWLVAQLIWKCWDRWRGRITRWRCRHCRQQHRPPPPLRPSQRLLPRWVQFCLNNVRKLCWFN